MWLFTVYRASQIQDICFGAAQTFTIRFVKEAETPLTIDFSELPDTLLPTSASTPVSQSVHALSAARTTSIQTFVDDLSAALKTTRPAVVSVSGAIVMAELFPEWFTLEQMAALARSSLVTEVEVAASSLFVTFSSPAAQSQTSLRVLKQRRPEVFTAKRKKSSLCKSSQRRVARPPKST